MRKIRIFCILSLLLGACFLNSLVASAHTLWINAVDYSPGIDPKYGAGTVVYFGWGHHYPVSDFLSVKSLKGFSLIYPDGKTKKLSPRKGGFLATWIKFKKPGFYIVSAVKKPGFYTMFVDEKGEVHHKTGPKTEVKGKIILSLYYEQYTKCLIDVGNARGNSFLKPIGHRLEIVPLKNPYKLRCGDFLPVKVLFKGKPARFCKVYVTYMGFSTGDDFAYATSTDSKGIARIRITHWGPHLIKTEIKLPAPDDLKGKCNQLHYTATMTFGVP